MNAIDAIALSILALALARGLWIGVVREVFSMAALAAACLAIRYGAGPAGAWLAAHSPLELDLLTARIAAAVGVGVATAVSVGLLGRLVRRGLRLAGLGVADRCAGGILGAVEGALVIGILLVLGLGLAGRDHRVLEESRTFAAYLRVERLASAAPPTLPDVAAPRRGR